MVSLADISKRYQGFTMFKDFFLGFVKIHILYHASKEPIYGAEILEELGSGVYLAGSRGGQVSTGEGVFQFNAKSGYLVEDGEKKQLLRDVSLSGKILETLLHVKAVGNDLKYNSGRCGKSGQLVPVSDGSPHLLVVQATVGGAG